MKIAAMHSHLNGFEWLLVHEKRIWDEIRRAIKAINASKLRKKRSKEKRKAGKLLYSPIALNRAFKKQFRLSKWKESRTSYWVTEDYRLIRETLPLPIEDQKKRIQDRGKRAIFRFNQTDFVKKRVAVEVQLGKYAFISYDLFVKHLAFFVGDQIDVGVEILPMKAMQEHMSSGVGYYEGALYDIARQGRGIPPVPLVVIGVIP